MYNWKIRIYMDFLYTTIFCPCIGYKKLSPDLRYVDCILYRYDLLIIIMFVVKKFILEMYEKFCIPTVP